MKIEVDQYQLIRHLRAVKGVYKREIARTLGISRNTVTKYCDGGAIPGQRKTPERESPVLTLGVIEFIQSCLDQDHAGEDARSVHTPCV